MGQMGKWAFIVGFVICVVAGLLIGRWIDRLQESAPIFLIFGMMIGVVAGCVTAWRMVSSKM